MLTITLFLGMATVIFAYSLRLLREIFPASRPQGYGRKSCRGWLMHVSGLVLWFSAGVVSFVTALTSLFEKLILYLQ
jgi:hypothetical protein